MTLDEVIKVFADDPLCHTITRESIFTCCTPSCAIKKVHDYEKKKKEEKDIKVGDEVAFYNDTNKAFFVTRIDDIAISGIDANGRTHVGMEFRFWKKTGRHFPQISEVLEKMKEDD